MKYVPLAVHSQFSILRGTASVKALADKAAALRLPAMGLADAGNMYGVVDFYKACQAHDIHPLIGSEMRLAPYSRKEKKKIPGKRLGYPLMLFAMNNVGYKNLCLLSSAGFCEGFYYTSRIDKVLLKEHAEGLLCLSGSLDGPLAQAILENSGDEELEWFLRVFKDRFYLQIERLEMTKEALQAEGMTSEPWLLAQYERFVADERKVNTWLIEQSKAKGVPLIAANGMYYLEREDWFAHEILLNVGAGECRESIEKDLAGNPKGKRLNPKRATFPTHEHDFKTPEEMKSRFADILDALAETIRFHERCTFQLDFSTRHYPVFIPPDLIGKEYTAEERDRSAKKYLKELCYAAVPLRYDVEKLAKVQEKYPGEDPLQVVHRRLKHELGLITRMGMSDYLLIVYDFIAWAKKQGIPVGPGRGSGAGSIILYLIGITDIEPLRFHLFFERFINPERISYPDIDVDICMERRDEVINYTVGKYGKKNVAHIITFGTMKAKMAIRDVGRVLDIPLPKVNAIAKYVPDDLGITLNKAIQSEPELKRLYEEDAEATTLLTLAQKLEGCIRNTGVHAAGLIICGDDLTQHIPVCTSKESSLLSTQYAMKQVEAVGMLKIDFLGLKTLTSIQKTVHTIQKTTGKIIDWVNLPLDDTATFSLLNQGKTLGVFQLESSGMQELAKQLHIDRFEEIIAVNALYRPGPMEMIPAFINRKHGREKIESEHPLVQDILQETYGIMVYQEQVIQIASRLAKYTLGEGDVLRKAMGKKEHKEMSRQKEKFRKGAISNGIDETVALEIFDKIEKFASYGFNKAHATAYAYLSYVTAYLKANYTKEWLAALMTSDQDDIEKVAKHIHEAQSFQIAILPPDVNESEKEFVGTSSGIRFAMGAIKGIGQGVVEAIEKERKRGTFRSLYDFCSRIDIKGLGKKTIELLIQVGCFDFTKWSRGELLEALDGIVQHTLQQQKEARLGVIDFFAKATQEWPRPQAKEIPLHELLRWEKLLLGIYLTGHPMHTYQEKIEQLGCVPLSALSLAQDGDILPIAFTIEEIKQRTSKTGRKFVILTISDAETQTELPLFSDIPIATLRESGLYAAAVEIEHKDGVTRLRPIWLSDMETALFQSMQDALARGKRKNRTMRKEARQAEREENTTLCLKIDANRTRMSDILHLKKLFSLHSGRIAVEILFQTATPREDRLLIGSAWGIRFDAGLEQKLKELPYITSIKLVHPE